MNIFGIGPLEIIFVMIIGILVLGPEGMVDAGRKLGKFLRTIFRSTWWQNVRRGVNEIQHLPQKLIREAELEELNELSKISKEEFPKIGSGDLLKGSSWTGNTQADQDQEPETAEKSKEQTTE